MPEVHGLVGSPALQFTDALFPVPTQPILTPPPVPGKLEREWCQRTFHAYKSVSFDRVPSDILTCHDAGDFRRRCKFFFVDSTVVNFTFYSFGWLLVSKFLLFCFVLI